MLTTLLAISSVVSSVVTVRSAVLLRKYRAPKLSSEAISFPSVSVCIAARNETHALARCLDNVIASSYDKLEILVLDDNSEDDTSLVIKSYAHAGVRFIAGKDLPAGWLGKNHSYQTLLEEASADLVMFVDVDTTLERTSIDTLVRTLSQVDSNMISVLPMRKDGHRNSAVFGTLRYFWELLLSTKDNPPAASAIWLADRKALLDVEKGLPEYKSSLRPEAHIAKQFARVKRYAYVIGSSHLGIGYEKQMRSQYETATRLYYPVIGRNPFRAIIALLLLFLLNLPFVLLIVSDQGVLALVAMAIGAASIAQFSYRTYPNGVFVRRIIFWPFIIVQETCLLLVSILKHMTKSITWKGRDILSRPLNRSHISIDE